MGARKTCAKCRTERPMEDFHRMKNSPDGRQYYCIPCGRARDRSGRVHNTPERRDAYLRKTYGIGLLDWERMKLDQDRRCAICKKPFTAEMNVGKGKKHIVVDHDHGTGAVRGLLCDNCNRGIGLIGDSVETLLAAAEYLKRHAEGGG